MAPPQRPGRKPRRRRLLTDRASHPRTPALRQFKRITATQSPVSTAGEGTPTFRNDPRTTRLEAAQAKSTSGETTRTAEAFTATLAKSQADVTLRVEEALTRLGEGTGAYLDTMTRQFTALGMAVDYEWKEWKEARGREAPGSSGQRPGNPVPCRGAQEEGGHDDYGNRTTKEWRPVWNLFHTPTAITTDPKPAPAADTATSEEAAQVGMELANLREEIVAARKRLRQKSRKRGNWGESKEGCRGN